MIKLVHPAPAGQAPARRRGRRSPALSLSIEETRRLRVAIRNLTRAYGTRACLADAIGVPPHALHQALYRNGKHPSAALALRIAQAGGMSVEAVLSGSLNAAERCGACGSRIGHGAQLAAEGAS